MCQVPYCIHCRAAAGLHEAEEYSNIPSLPDFDHGDEAYYAAREEVSKYLLSDNFRNCLRYVLNSNDLRTYLKLEALWSASPGFGRRGWMEAVAEASA